MSSPLDLVGVYGKIPVLGDFITRRLPGAFVECWDVWLQRSIKKSKRSLGKNWLDIYLTSPIWKFILRPGVSDDKGWAGVLIPSVDRVGRYFPLTLSVPLEEKFAVPLLFSRANHWFSALEVLALSALRDDFDKTEFDQPIGPSLKEFSSWLETVEISDFDENDSLYSEIDPSGDGFEEMAVVLSHLLSRTNISYSFWQTNGSQRVKPCLRVFHGLPPAIAFHNFLRDA